MLSLLRSVQHTTSRTCRPSLHCVRSYTNLSSPSSCRVVNVCLHHHHHQQQQSHHHHHQQQQSHHHHHHHRYLHLRCDMPAYTSNDTMVATFCALSTSCASKTSATIIATHREMANELAHALRFRLAEFSIDQIARVTAALACAHLQDDGVLSAIARECTWRVPMLPASEVSRVLVSLAQIACYSSAPIGNATKAFADASARFWALRCDTLNASSLVSIAWAIAHLAPLNREFGEALAELVRQQSLQFTRDDQRRLCWALDNLKCMSTSLADQFPDSVLSEASSEEGAWWGGTYDQQNASAQAQQRRRQRSRLSGSLNELLFQPIRNVVNKGLRALT